MRLVRLKRSCLQAAVVFLVFSALLACFEVLVFADAIVTKLLFTTLLLGCFSLVSYSNISRLDTDRQLVKTTAMLALISSMICLSWDRSDLSDTSRVSSRNHEDPSIPDKNSPISV